MTNSNEMLHFEFKKNKYIFRVFFFFQKYKVFKEKL